MLIILYLVAGEHLVHHAFMFRGVVAVVGGGEGPVWTAGEKKKAVKPVMLGGPNNNRSQQGGGLMRTTVHFTTHFYFKK